MAVQPPVALPNRAELLEEYDIITEDDTEEIKEALEGGRMADATSKIMENLQALENARLDIAVTGECGSGKSSFVNAIRGLGDTDDGAAPTGVVETTVKPIPYQFNKYPNVTIWDLPGIGTPNFQPNTYLKQVNFSCYDFFIIIASERFKFNHARLAQEIQMQGKRFYFVRSKVDMDVQAARTRRQHTDEEGVLQQIRKNCQECLEAENVASSHIFLLSNWDFSKYDFMLLEETLEQELPSHKRHAFLLALPNISLEILRKKEETLRKQIWKLAIASCGAAAMPIPGLSMACDVAILVKSLSEYRKNFGLDDESLENLAKKVDKPVEEIKEVITSPLAKEITKDAVVKMLSQGVKVVIKSPLAKQTSKNVVLKTVTKTGGGTLMVILNCSKVSIFGSLVAGGIAFGTTYYMLCSSLNEIAKIAQDVLIKALESHV